MATASLELLADSSQIRTATRDLDRLNATGSQTERAQNNLNRSIKQTSGSMAGLSKNFGQAGIQVQQFVGQIQGGQSGLLALSQQGADLGIVLGQAGLGAAVGITATALSFMIGNSDDATSALDRLDDIADTVGKTLEQAADGSDVFSESIQRLANRSEALARVQIAQTISDLNEQISTSARGIREAISEFNGIRMDVGVVDTLQSLGLQLEDIPDLFGDISSQVDTLGAGGVLTIRGLTERIDLLANSLDISREQATSLQVAIDDFSQDQSATGIARLRGEIESLTNAVGVDNDKLVSFASSLSDFFESTRTGVDRINLLRQAIAELKPTLDANSGETDKASKRSLNYAQSLQTQIVALQGGAQAAEVYALTQRAIAEGTQEQLPRLIELVNQKYELKRAQEAAAESAKQEADSIKQLESDYEQFLRIVDQAEASRMSRLQSAASGTSGLTSLQALEQQYTTEKQLLEEAQAEGIASTISYQDRLTQLQKEYSDRRAQIIATEQNTAIKFISDGTSASLNAFAQTLGNVASIAAQGGEESFQTYKNLASAQAAISATLSVLAVLGDPSIPTVARIPLAASIGALAAANVIMIQRQEYNGARALGGQVVRGGSYLVGERGPEMFTPNGSGGGRVTPFNQLMNEAGKGGGNTNVMVNVTNNATNSEVSTEERQDAQGNRVIDIVVNNINQRGKIHKAMTQTTTAGNRI